MEPLDRLRGPLAALMRWFDSAELRAAIVGGVAASLRGKPRLTKDVDAIILDVELEAVLDSGRSFGFRPRSDDAVEFARTTRVLLMRYDPGAVEIDLSLGALPFEEEVVDRSTDIDVGGLLLRVATAEDLIIMKAVAGRPRDIADVESILAVQQELDVDRIRYWTREFSTVLEMPEIHENLEILLKRRR